MKNHTRRFTSPVVVGQTVTGISEGPGYRTEWSGIYEGVRESEWDKGVMVHFFGEGIIGTTPQDCFTMPVSQFTATEV